MTTSTFDTGWWHSAHAVARIARGSAIAAGVLLGLGALTFPFTWVVSIPAIVGGMTSVLCAMFAWFRAEHLREISSPPVERGEHGVELLPETLQLGASDPHRPA